MTRCFYLKEMLFTMSSKLVENSDNHFVKNDISSNKDILESYENSPYKKWIKLIPNDKTVSFEDYNRKNNFSLIADIVLDDELFTSGKKKRQQKKKYFNSICSNHFNWSV